MKEVENEVEKSPIQFYNDFGMAFIFLKKKIREFILKIICVILTY